MTAHRALPAAIAVAATILLAGCGGGGSAPATSAPTSTDTAAATDTAMATATDTASATSTDTTTLSPSTTDTTSAMSPTETQFTSPEPSEMAGAKTVAFGQSAVVPLAPLGGQPEVPIETTVIAAKGKIADLSSYNLSSEDKKGTPYYVSFIIKNTGTTVFDSSGFAGNLSVLDADDKEIPRVSLIGRFLKCEGNPPDKLKPGASARGCDVYLAPPGVTIGSVTLGTADTGAIWK